MPEASVGLVLGAGGILGMAYHAGALAAIQEACGWDARRAGVLVGTSAGAIAAAGLRAGMPPADQFAIMTGATPSPTGRALMGRAEAARGLGPRLAARQPSGRRPHAEGAGGWRRLRPANPALVARAWSPWARVPLGVALAGALPAGWRPTEMISEPIDRLHPGWPAEATWLVTVRLRDGTRVVVGRDQATAGFTLGTAAAAASAIPGWFRPVAVGGERYVDGGAHSTTNADLCADRGLDLVVVVAPMSATSAVLRSGLARLRALHAQALAREVARVRRSGTPVLTVQPTAADRVLLRRSPMDPSAAGAVALAARRSVLDRLGDPRVADRVAPLRGAQC